MTQERLYTSTQLGRILNLPPAKIRAWTRQGLMEPAKKVGRLSFFDFRQLTSARALNRLRDAGVPPRHIRKALADLSVWAPDVENVLTQLEADGGALVIRTDGGEIAEATGQMRFDLDPHTGEARETTATLRALPEAQQAQVAWFERGILAEEEGRLEDAADAYARALALEGARAEVRFNLGNVLYALERKPEAAAFFRGAVELESDYAEAWNNLGSALADLEEHEGALDAFEHALRGAPGYADPHYNVAETLEALGRRAEARQHWRTYLNLDPHSPWADEARRRLETP